MKRTMFVINPEMWDRLYGEPAPGTAIYREPATADEFREMLEEWGEEDIEDLLAE